MEAGQLGTYGPLIINALKALAFLALFFDTLRRRGNQTLAHYHAGKPPVLIFDYEIVLDGASFRRPCNYLLLRIVAPEDAPTDPVSGRSTTSRSAAGRCTPRRYRSTTSAPPCRR